MTVTTYTRPAKCKDCLNLRYYYKGKRKLHKCIATFKPARLNDSAAFCIDQNYFELNTSTFPKKLEEK